VVIVVLMSLMFCVCVEVNSRIRSLFWIAVSGQSVSCVGGAGVSSRLRLRTWEEAPRSDAELHQPLRPPMSSRRTTIQSCKR
jgi:hypothetical protein